MSKCWSSIAPPPLSFSLRPSIDAGANSRAGMDVPNDPEVGPDKELSTFNLLLRVRYEIWLELWLRGPAR